MPQTDTSPLPAESVPAVVHQVIRLVAPQPTEQIDDGQQLIGQLGFHSLALAELGFTLEDLFGLDSITPERAMSLRTVGDLVALIDEALADGLATPPDVGQVQAVCAQYGSEWSPAG